MRFGLSLGFTGAAGGIPPGPVNTVAPEITGTTARGEVLTCSTGTWTGTGVISYARQWTRNGANIAAATSGTYTLAEADDNAMVGCRVTATDDEGSRSHTAPAVGPILGAPLNLALPAITGVATVGETLTCSTGTWQGVATITYAYQWRRNAVNIGSATASTYTLVEADRDTEIDCVVTATNSLASTPATALAVGPVLGLQEALLAGFTSGLAIHSEAPEAEGVMIRDSGDAYQAMAAWNGTFASPKMITDSNGSLRWAPHNALRYSADPSHSNWTKTTISTTGGQADAFGGSAGWLLQATSTTSSIRQAPGTVFGVVDRWVTHSIIAAPGTSNWVCVSFADSASRDSWVNLSTGGLGTVAAGVTVNVHTTDEDGAALQNGYRRVEFSTKLLGTLTVWVRIVDADNSTAVTSGANIRLTRQRMNLGVNPVKYVDTTAVALYSTPYDWSLGTPHILLETNGTYNSRHANDLANAAWTKTGCTAVLDQVGPDGEPCSSLTFGEANGTCLQSVTSASANQRFMAYVKRLSGTGTIEITLNNGSTWTDITSLINGVTYTKIMLKGAANPVFGFRGATVSDAIAVQHALTFTSTSVSGVSPYPVYGANVSRSADVITKPVSGFPFDPANWSAFVEYTRYAIDDVISENCIRFANAGTTEYADFHCITGSNIGTFRIAAAIGGSASANLFNVVASQNLQLTMRVEGANHAASANLEPALFIHDAGQPVVENLVISINGSIFLRRLCVVPQAIGDDNIRTQWARP